MEGPLALLRRYGHDADPAVLAILHADLDPELKATLLRNHIARLDLPELSPVPVVGGALPPPSPPPPAGAPPPRRPRGPRPPLHPHTANGRDPRPP